MKGIRGFIGNTLIDNALAQFESASRKLTDGIVNCQADIQKHEDAIEESTAKIADLKETINKAERVKSRIADFLA